MKRRRFALFVPTGLALVTAVSLTACGGSGDAKSGARGGARTGDGASAEPSAARTPGVARPVIEVPADLTYRFDWPRTGDREKDAVLSDTEQRVRAVDMAVARQKPLDHAYRFYSRGAAAASSQEFIQSFVDSGSRITGKKRYFEPEVRVSGDGTAAFTYCEDQGEAFNQDLKTGEVQRTRRTADSYVLYTTRLRVDEHGVWAVEKMLSERGSAACRP